jgi:hypothetical protein
MSSNGLLSLRQLGRGRLSALPALGLLFLLLAANPLAGTRDVQNDRLPKIALSPGWQRYARPDALLTFSLSPSALLKLPSMESFAAGAEALVEDHAFAAVKGIGVPLAAIELVVSQNLTPSKENKDTEEGLQGQFFFIRLRSPKEADEFLRHCFPDAETIIGKNGTYYRIKNAVTARIQGNYFIRPDLRTVAFGRDEKEVNDWLANPTKPTDLPHARLWPSEQTICSLAVNYASPDTQGLPENESELPDDLPEAIQGLVGLLDAFPIPEVAIFSLHACDDLSFTCSLVFEEDDDAVQCKALIDGMTKLIRGLELEPVAVSKEVTVAKVCRSLITQTKTRQSESTLTITTKCPFKLGDVVDLIVKEINSDKTETAIRTKK